MNGDKRQLLTTLEFEVSEISIDRGTMGNYTYKIVNIIDKFSSRSYLDVISLLEHATLESTNGRRIEVEISLIKKYGGYILL